VSVPRTRVLFVNTPTRAPLGADTWVHAQIMRELDRSTTELWAACVTGGASAPTPTYLLLRQIPDLRFRSVNFGPELHGRSWRGKLRALVSGVRVVPSFVRLVALVRYRHVQIIHTSDRPRDAFVCVLLARLTGATCVIHVHVGYGEWMSGLLKWALKRADALVAVSDFVARTLVASGHSAAKIHVVLNAIDPADWTPTEERDAARREFGVPEHAPLVITVCRLFPAKGVEELIRAVAAVREEYPAVRLMIVGQEMVTGFHQRLVDLADELGVGQHVVFTGQRSDVRRLMEAADVFAMPSVGEPFGLVFLEAMAMQLPVVALDSGGTSEVVQDGVTGLLSAPGDTQQLMENLLALLRDPARRQRMGAAGRQRMQALFTSHRMAADTAMVYKRLTSQK